MLSPTNPRIDCSDDEGALDHGCQRLHQHKGVSPANNGGAYGPDIGAEPDYPVRRAMVSLTPRRPTKRPHGERLTKSRRRVWLIIWQ